MDDYAIATAAAQRVIAADIKQYVPPVFQDRIPAEAIAKLAAEVGKAVVDDLAKARSQ